ncbi:MAG: hypothetical protein Q7T74_01620 [Candidatus Saccharibacteria bacterium]|nr:hypothetical protein [Candidatus Saccharibacteria bacterium]
MKRTFLLLVFTTCSVLCGITIVHANPAGNHEKMKDPMHRDNGITSETYEIDAKSDAAKTDARLKAAQNARRRAGSSSQSSHPGNNPSSSGASNNGSGGTGGM